MKKDMYNLGLDIGTSSIKAALVNAKNNNGLVKTEIFDIIGNRLLVSTENIISIQHFSNGVYVVKVTHNNEVSEFKVIKE